MTRSRAGSIPSLLLRDGQIVTMNARREVFEGDVLVVGERIAAIGKGRLKVRGRVRTLDLGGRTVLPGLIQAHVHLCQTLFRGMADDLPLLEWLTRRIWPLEAAHDERSLRASARLGLAELLRGGTTSIVDMGTVHHTDALFAAIAESGIRAWCGKAMMDAGEGVPARLRETTEGSLKEALRLFSRWDGKHGGRLHYAFAPRFVLSCTGQLLCDVAQAAQERGALVHSHVAEQREERRRVLAERGADDVEYLDRMGIGGPRALLAHGVQLRDDEIARLAAKGTRIVHCPSSNQKLGSGIARVPEMIDKGVVVAIGADGAPCNNSLDVFAELRRAALLAKPRLGPAAFPAPKVFELATLGGARALGREEDLGSIEAGKLADLVVIDLERTHTLPGGDVYSRLVYAARPDDVTDVFVGGRPVVASGELTTLDEERVRRDAVREAPRLLRRAGLA